MCGIAGFLSFNRDTSQFDIDAAVQALSHRGPDDRGVYGDEWVSMGYRRLSIIDLETGHQPIFNEDSKIVLIANCEIYNYKELRRDLVSRGHTFKSKSDSEVIIHAYEEYGIDKALELLNGMFAFAIWDKRIKKLFLARDRLGIKPVYYSLKKDFITFASEIKSLFVNGMVSKRLRSGCLFEYFTNQGIFGSKTIFADVTELQPGHFMAVDDKGTQKIKRYWDIVSICGSSGTIDEERAILDGMDRELKRSVDYRLISDVPVGVLLSGGIDSSLIADYVAGSKHANAKSAKFFNARNVNPEIDESKYAGLQAEFIQNGRAKRIDFESLTLKSNRFLEYFPFLTYIYDEPLQFQSSGYIYDMCSQSRREGIKVLLVGEGSDELFFGYDRFWRTLSHIAEGRYEGYSEDEIVYYGGGIDNASLLGRLTGMTRASIEEIESFSWLRSHGDLDLRTRIMLYSIIFRLQSVLMRMDRMSMATGTEVRVPFLDHKVVEFAITINNDVKGKDAIPKYLVKRLASGRVHEEIIKRKKMGSPSDVAYWLEGSQAEHMLRDLTSSSGSISKSELDHSAVEEIVNAFYKGDKRYSVLIWMLLAIEMWNSVMKSEKPAGVKEEIYG